MTVFVSVSSHPLDEPGAINMHLIPEAEDKHLCLLLQDLEFIEKRILTFFNELSKELNEKEGRWKD